MAGDFEVTGDNTSALFNLKIYRGEGMALIAMNWKKGPPPKEFAGFSIEYREPGGNRFFALKNRLSFAGSDEADPNRLSTQRSPIQKFRWVHFPRNAEIDGKFIYRVTPVFMNDADELSYGAAQEAAIVLRAETYPGKLNVTFTRGFVSSQVFVDRYAKFGEFKTLIPAKAATSLDFEPSHPKSEEALKWMGFEARQAILETLDAAIKDKAEVRVVAYDLNEPALLERLEKVGGRLKIIIDDSAEHGKPGSAETAAAKRLMASAGKANIKRHHMKSLQHNKIIVVDGSKVKKAVCGSTNFSWRGFFVQSNNAVIVEGAKAIKPFLAAFDQYWNDEASFGKSASAEWTNLGLDGIGAKIAFSPHSSSNALLEEIASDISGNTKSSLFFSLAFLYQTHGKLLSAIKLISSNKKLFVYGISDKKVGGLDLKKPDGNIAPVFPTALAKNLPEPFSEEPSGGGGNRMHHKFVVVDFDKPSARVYFGSYNFSEPADVKNGENLLLIKDRRIAVSYMIEALRIFDHYHFRVALQESKKAKKKLELLKPPRKAGEKPWWDGYYHEARKIRDRELFA